MRLLLPFLSLALSSCSFYQLNTHSLLDSVGKEEAKVDPWAATSYTASEYQDVLYLKVPVYYAAPPAALLTGTCPFVDGGDKWQNWWSFPEYRPQRTNNEIAYLYFPLEQSAISTINQQNRTKLTYRNYRPAAYTMEEFEKLPHRVVATGIKIPSLDSVIRAESAGEKTSAVHYIVKPLSYVALGLDTVSIVPCSLVGGFCEIFLSIQD